MFNLKNEKMKKFENYGVLEMNKKEIVNFSGGGDIAYIVGWFIGAVAGSLYTVGSSIDDNLPSEEASFFQTATGGTKW